MGGKFKEVSARSRAVSLSGIRKMFDLAERYSGVINLALGEPDFSTPQHVLDATSDALKAGYTHYTSNAGSMELREAVAEKLRRDNGIDADPSTEIIVTAGAMGALSLAMFTMIDQGDEVLIPDPGFESYKAQAMLVNAKPIPLPLREENEFSIDPDDIINRLSPKTKALIINSPSNPTGAYMDDRELRNIAQIICEHDLVVISDEAYESILYDEAKHFSIASLPEMRERTISIYSLSKTYAMTGWRIGYAVADEMIIHEMIKLQGHIMVHPSSISQRAAIAALRGPQDCVQKMVKEYEERRNLMVDGINVISRVTSFKPKGAFYLFPNISRLGLSSLDLAMYLLEKAGVVTVPGTSFGEYGEGHLRLSYSASRGKIIEAVSRMREAIEKLPTRGLND
jgi:aspartate/methionine/tyrosine aminotransferase